MYGVWVWKLVVCAFVSVGDWEVVSLEGSGGGGWGMHRVYGIRRNWCDWILAIRRGIRGR